MVRHHRTLLSHPAVQGATYWGITDAGAWLGAPVGLLRADGTPKPAHDALRDLVKGEWWLPPTALRTDDAGRVDVTGFLGDYTVSGPGGTATLALDRAGAVDVEVRLS